METATNKAILVVLVAILAVAAFGVFLYYSRGQTTSPVGSSLQSEVSSLSSQVSSLNSQVGSLTGQITALDNEVAQLKANLSGLTSTYSGFEKLGISTQYATGSSGGGWDIYLGGMNTGSAGSTIVQIQVNGVPYPIQGNVKWCAGSGGCTLPSSNTTSSTLTVLSGQAFEIEFGLSQSMLGKTFSSGQTIQVTVITAAGNNYPASIVLP